MIDDDRPQSDQHAASLLSTIGAAVAGLGGGVLLSASLHSFGWWLLGLGAVAHFAGMVGKRRIEERSGYRPARWERAGYWLCWAALAALALWVVVDLV